MWSPGDGNPPYLCLGATSLLAPSYKYLKSEIHLRNAQANKASSVIKDSQNLLDCGHSKEKLVVNCFCWLWVALLRLGSF